MLNLVAQWICEQEGGTTTANKTLKASKVRSIVVCVTIA